MRQFHRKKIPRRALCLHSDAAPTSHTVSGNDALSNIVDSVLAEFEPRLLAEIASNWHRTRIVTVPVRKSPTLCYPCPFGNHDAVKHRLSEDVPAHGFMQIECIPPLALSIHLMLITEQCNTLHKYLADAHFIETQFLRLRQRGALGINARRLKRVSCLNT